MGQQGGPAAGARPTAGRAHQRETGFGSRRAASARQGNTGQLVKQAERYANQTSQAASNAQKLVATVASPPGRLGRIDTAVKKILARYTSIVAQTKSRERRIRSAAVRRKIDTLLSQAKRSADNARTRQGIAIVDTLAQLNRVNALRQIVMARTKAANALAIAKSALRVAADDAHG